MRAIIDTNVLVYDTFEDSEYHKEARRLLNGLDIWMIPTIVLHEYVWVLKALNVNPNDVLYKVEEYCSHYKSKIISERLSDVTYALETVASEGLSLSRYNDKVILSIAVREKVNLATFDEKLRKQALSKGVNVIP
ncbi:PilT protein domain protein [Ferroglobus placidus DSM 10642]|uniref:PilT protein domain protein n=1 Tax=Ferroglobus placidus (strain DSM 10642 / AEDII12DO) TaxID=589924 RepID=D3RX10_FERPA|nr:PIN domain-containing protein [Ferroglobus placidus]ADC65023.1 PilT protein domain protein [Ferroglobus placidus DSM 10642]